MWHQEDQEFKTILDFRMSLRLAWATLDAVFKKDGNSETSCTYFRDRVRTLFAIIASDSLFLFSGSFEGHFPMMAITVLCF